jgi:hypothetical protein
VPQRVTLVDQASAACDAVGGVAVVVSAAWRWMLSKSKTCNRFNWDHGSFLGGAAWLLNFLADPIPRIAVG